MRNKLLIMALAVVTPFAFSGCMTMTFSSGLSNDMPNSVIINREPVQKFLDLTYGLETRVLTTPMAEEKAKTMYHLASQTFFSAPTIQYVRSMGLKEMSPKTDYKLFITINRADIDKKGQNSWIDLNVVLEDAKGIEAYSQVINSNYKSEFGILILGQSEVLNEAYTQALEQINWNRIASFLKTEQLPKDEPQKQVQGLGDTALEQTIIRWDVQSRPQGADVFWRVVSKTPEVKSTNNKYLQTTPYEATKALDIRGLTYETSGNVRIILRCEKDGYMPQEKEYDVRMVLDQEEISAFFRLVKEE